MAFNNTRQAALEALNTTIDEINWDASLPDCRVIATHAGRVPFDDFDPLSIDYYVASWRSWVTGVVLASVLLLITVLFILWLLWGTCCACCCRKRRVWKPIRVRYREDARIYKGAEDGVLSAMSEITQMESCCCCRFPFRWRTICRHLRTMLLVVLVLATMGVAIWCLVINWRIADEMVDKSWALYWRVSDKVDELGGAALSFLSNANTSLGATSEFVSNLQGTSLTVVSDAIGVSLEKAASMADQAMIKVDNTASQVLQGMQSFSDEWESFSENISTAWQFIVLCVLLALILGALLLGLLGSFGCFGRLGAVITVIMLLATIPLVAVGAIAMSTAWNTASDGCLYLERYVATRELVKIEPPAARYSAIFAAKSVIDIANSGWRSGAGDLEVLTTNLGTSIAPTLKTDLLQVVVDQLPPELLNISSSLQSTNVLGDIIAATSSLLDRLGVGQVLADLIVGDSSSSGSRRRRLLTSQPPTLPPLASSLLASEELNGKHDREHGGEHDTSYSRHNQQQQQQQGFKRQQAGTLVEELLRLAAAKQAIALVAAAWDAAPAEQKQRLLDGVDELWGTLLSDMDMLVMAVEEGEAEVEPEVEAEEGDEEVLVMAVEEAEAEVEAEVETEEVSELAEEEKAEGGIEASKAEVGAARGRDGIGKEVPGAAEGEAVMRDDGLASRRRLQQQEEEEGEDDSGDGGDGPVRVVVDRAGRIVGNVTEKAISLLDEAEDKAESMASKALENAAGALEGVKHTVSDVADSARSKAEAVAGTASETVATVRGKGQRLWELVNGTTIAGVFDRVGLYYAADVVSSLPPDLRDVLALAVNLEATAAAANFSVPGIRDAIVGSDLESADTLQLLLAIANMTVDSTFVRYVLNRTGIDRDLAREFLELVNPNGPYLGATVRSAEQLGQQLLTIGIVQTYIDIKDFMCCDLNHSLRQLYIAFTLTGVMAATVSLILAVRTVMSALTPERDLQRSAVLADLDSKGPMGAPGVVEMTSGHQDGDVDDGGIIKLGSEGPQFISGAGP